MTADVRRILAERGNEESTDSTTSRAADAATVDDALRHLRRHLTTSVVNRYLSRNMQAAINKALEEDGDPSAVNVTAIRARVAALAFIETDVQKAVEDAPDALTKLWLTTRAKDIAKLSDSRQPTYEAIQDMARSAERVAIEIKSEERVDSVDIDLKPLPTEHRHVLATADGEYPLEPKMAKNRWERATTAHERELGTLEGWYRNPSAGGKNALRIVHESGGVWRSVQPDFVFVHTVVMVMRYSRRSSIRTERIWVTRHPS